MKTLHKVSVLEIKRCFVVGNLLAARSHKGHMKKLESETHYIHRLSLVRAKVLRMKESQLDRVIGEEWQKRLHAYENSSWCVAEAKPSELGVWSKAGELPLRWTNHSLRETAEKVVGLSVGVTDSSMDAYGRRMPCPGS